MPMMYAARILYPVKTLGPGDRVGIWLCGCPRRCRGCSNPELWTQQEKYRISRGNLLRLVRSISDSAPVDGFTVTGGDPFMQAQELALLLPELRRISRDILVYTGYTLEQLTERHSPAVDAALRNISVLIDGEYIEERNTGLTLRGSDNQRIFCFDGELRPRYDEYLRQGGGIQDFPAEGGAVSVGIHRADYPEQLERLLSRKPLIKCGEIDQEENGR